MPAPSSTTPPTSDDHVAEHIPWDQLTIQPPPDHRRLWYGAALALVALAVLIVVVRAFERPRPMLEPVLVDPAPVTTAATAAIEAPSPSTSLAALPAPDLLSEADLMAVDPIRLERSVVARAEALVLEFFTLDPGDGWSTRVARGAARPLEEGIGPSGPEEATVSYVEWVAASDVEGRGSGRYVVDVAMRRLVAIDGATYVRLPIEWVRVEVRVDTAGVPRAGSLPTVIEGPGVDGEVLVSSGRFVDSIGIDWPSTTGSALVVP